MLCKYIHVHCIVNVLTRGLTKSLVSDQLIVLLRNETSKGIQQACYHFNYTQVISPELYRISVSLCHPPVSWCRECSKCHWIIIQCTQLYLAMCIGVNTPGKPFFIYTARCTKSANTSTTSLRLRACLTSNNSPSNTQKQIKWRKSADFLLL